MGHDEHALISAHKLARRVGVKRAEIWRWSDPNKTDDPLPSWQVGNRAKRYKESVTREWLERRMVRGRIARGTNSD